MTIPGTIASWRLFLAPDGAHHRVPFADLDEGNHLQVSFDAAMGIFFRFDP